MDKKKILALIIVALVALVLIMNRGWWLGDKMEVNLLFTKIETIKSVVLLAFTAIGVVIGILLGK